MRDWLAKLFPGPRAEEESAASLYSRGENACDEGRFEQAVELLALAIRSDGSVAAFHYKLGVAFQALGDFSSAEASYRKAIELDRNYARAFNNLGSVLQTQGRLREALDCYEAALRLQPDLLHAARNLSIAWLEQGEAGRAEQAARHALTLAPRDAELHVHLANALSRSGKLDEALACCRKAVELAPELARAYDRLGTALKELGRLQEAIAAYRKAVELDANTARFHVNLGIALQESGDLAQAFVHCSAALALQPDLAEAWLTMGLVRELQDDAASAQEHYRKAAEIRPDFAQAHFNHALHLLRSGDFARGWEEYEWRWQLPELAGLAPRFERPHWDGSDPGGKTVLIYAEQGFGDVIQFLRYVPLVARRGGKVVLRCPAQLKTLAATMTGVSEAIDDEQKPPHFDLCCALLSLPRIFKTTPDSIPADVPYIHPAGDKVARWREKIAGDSAVLRVGLAWASHSRNAKFAARKSVGLAALAPLARVPRVALCSLQKGAAAAQARRPPEGMTLFDWTGEILDFSDTAALIANLDLVISVDTSVAHLAGAMGKPVWTLAAFPTDWRWMTEGSSNPWYPTMRVFRQRRLDAWTDVVQQVAQALAEAASSAAARPV